MKISNTITLQALIAIALNPVANALSSEVAIRNRSILQSSLASIANKLTLSPEIIIPEPTDPTALLLQSTEVSKMSNSIRTKAKANAAFISGSINSLKIFCQEQETARGNFPGPLPVIYCESSIEDNVDMADVADAGAAGFLYTTLKGEHVSTADDIKKDDKVKACFDSAIENGMQLIPEIVLNPDKKFSEDEVTAIVEAISEQCGADPTAVLLTVAQQMEDEDEDEDGEASEEEESNHEMNLPPISKDLTKRIPILGSIRAKAGGGRMGSAVGAHKESGSKGCVLRCDCLPGYRMNPDLEFVGGFWGAAIGDLKSLKSKNFNFRSTFALEKDIPMEWFNYQKDIMESGALGGAGGGAGDENPLDTANGDHQGF
jgi:hypothetical protein